MCLSTHFLQSAKTRRGESGRTSLNPRRTLRSFNYLMQDAGIMLGRHLKAAPAFIYWDGASVRWREEKVCFEWCGACLWFLQRRTRPQLPLSLSFFLLAAWLECTPHFHVFKPWGHEGTQGDLESQAGLTGHLEERPEQSFHISALGVHRFTLMFFFYFFGVNLLRKLSSRHCRVLLFLFNFKVLSCLFLLCPHFFPLVHPCLVAWLWLRSVVFSCPGVKQFLSPLIHGGSLYLSFAYSITSMFSFLVLLSTVFELPCPALPRHWVISSSLFFVNKPFFKQTHLQESLKSHLCNRHETQPLIAI